MRSKARRLFSAFGSNEAGVNGGHVKILKSLVKEIIRILGGAIRRRKSGLEAGVDGSFLRILLRRLRSFRLRSLALGTDLFCEIEDPRALIMAQVKNLRSTRLSAAVNTSFKLWGLEKFCLYNVKNGTSFPYIYPNILSAALKVGSLFLAKLVARAGELKLADANFSSAFLFNFLEITTFLVFDPKLSSSNRPTLAQMRSDMRRGFSRLNTTNSTAGRGMRSSAAVRSGGPRADYLERLEDKLRLQREFRAAFGAE